MSLEEKQKKSSVPQGGLSYHAIKRPATIIILMIAIVVVGFSDAHNLQPIFCRI